MQGTKRAKTYESSPRWKNIKIEFGADPIGDQEGPGDIPRDLESSLAGYTGSSFPPKMFTAPDPESLLQEKDVISILDETNMFKAANVPMAFEEESDQVFQDETPINAGEVPLASEHEMKRIVRATEMFEAEHKECVRVLPYTKDGQSVVQFYVYIGEAGIPNDLKEKAKECFEKMNVKLKWLDLYTNSVNILKVRPLQCPSGEIKTLDASESNTIDAVISSNLPALLKHRNITSVQASFKITESKQTNKPCITIYVLGKGSIPFGETEFPPTLGGYPIDVVDGFWFRTNRPWAPIKAQEPSEVLYSGASIGVQGENESGTLGAIVEDGDSFYALSCNHVMKSSGNSNPIIVHPGVNDHLNFVRYYLDQYAARVKQLPDVEIEFSVHSFDTLTELRQKFEELKSVKNEHINDSRCKDKIKKEIREMEEYVQRGVDPPREIGKYVDGISGNVTWTDGKEHYIDAALAKLSDNEVTSLKESGRARILGDTLVDETLTIDRECSPAVSASIRRVEKLCKSGRTTGFTSISDRLIGGPSTELPHYMEEPDYKLDDIYLTLPDDTNYVCQSCVETKGIPKDPKTLKNPKYCVYCRVNRTNLFEGSRSFRNCLCIYAGTQPFADKGDSGAVIFEERQNDHLLGFGLLFAIHDDTYHRAVIASPLQIVLETLSKKLGLPEDRKLKLVSDLTE